MSVEKRPRSSTPKASNNADIVDLVSDNEEPPRKKQRSVTPVRNGVISSYAKPATTRVTTTAPTPPPHQQYGPADVSENPVSKKASPWKSRPSWQKSISSSASLTDVARRLTASIGDTGPPSTRSSTDQRKSKEWTPNDNNRLRGLSISQERPELIQPQENINRNGVKYERLPNTLATENSTSDLEDEREQMINTFRFPHASALRFNPTNSGPLPKIGSENYRRQQQVGSSARHSIRPPSSSSTPAPTRNPSSAALLDTHSAGSKSKVEVNIPVRSTSASSPPIASLVTSAPVKQTGLIPPRPQQTPKFSINVPLSNTAKRQRERKALQEKLTEGADYAKEHPREVERLLGLTGFSTEFPANLDEEKYRSAAQPKKRTVKRSQLQLDMGQPVNLHQAIQSHVNHDFVHPKDQAKAILIARFAERFRPPLTFSNNVNDRNLNGKFQFVSEYILRRGVKETGPIGQPGCGCVGECDITCACLRKKFKDDKTKREWSEQIPQYQRRSDGLVTLKDDFMIRHAIQAHDENDENGDNQVSRQRVEISECNENCSCDNSCTNRVVQKGRTVPLAIFETNRCGFGVRSSANLVRGQFIEFYLGEVITENELIRREEAAEAGSTSYIYSLDWFSSQQPYHIDGENFGSAMRFVNHSCDPNAGTFPVLNNKSTKQLHYVAFFALKDIPAGTEITIDYSPQSAGTIYELNAADEGMEKCYCGAKNCRQMLWRPGKERKTRKKLGKGFD